jgi:hypothetical protein
MDNQLAAVMAVMVEQHLFQVHQLHTQVAEAEVAGLHQVAMETLVQAVQVAVVLLEQLQLLELQTQVVEAALVRQMIMHELARLAVQEL